VAALPHMLADPLEAGHRISNLWLVTQLKSVPPYSVYTNIKVHLHVSFFKWKLKGCHVGA
jgi:hypothetical protein